MISEPNNRRLTPAVSVIMPVHNGVQFIDEAIRSVLHQTFPDFELIVVDDGSTDGTPDILAKWEIREGRMLRIRQEWIGIVGALNAGIQLANGKYMVRMDADDISYPTRLECQLRFLEKHTDVVAVGTWSWYVDAAGRLLKCSREYVHSEEIEAGLLRGEGGALLHPTLMARLDIVRKIGGYRREYELAEDMDLYFRLLEHGKLANVPEPLLRYRLHYESTNHTRSDRQWELVESMLREQHARRKLPLPAPRQRPPLVSRAECHRRWAREAMLGSNWLTALIHSFHSFRYGPLDPLTHALFREVARRWLRVWRRWFFRLRSG